MSSVVYYKFFHQKNRSVIHFDGTAISVFDLKRQIIEDNQLGSGNDFNLRLYHSEQPDVEYELDQDVIPRSSYVIARRSPATLKSGRFNNASRYVTGKPRINRKVMSNAPLANTGATTNTTSKPIDENISEEDRIKLMFENQSNAWAQTQDELAHHKMVYYKHTPNTKQEDQPPPGYICYRCGKKDHWIKNCPTNNDPNFEGKKIMRTTGIPKSYLKTISKEELEKKADSLTTNENGDVVDREGNAILITDEGEYAIALADSKTWLSYQEKLQNAQRKSKQEFEQKLIAFVEQDNKPEFWDPLSSTKKVLEAPIVTTPCCTKLSDCNKLKNINYNQSELERILIDNDFHCPNCGKDDIFIDSLIPNTDLQTELEEYIKSKEAAGLKDPTKRSAEEVGEGEGPDSKKQKTGNEFQLPLVADPTMFPPPPPGMPPLPFGLPPGMPPIPMGMPPPPPPGMFLPAGMPPMPLIPPGQQQPPQQFPGNQKK